MDKHQSINYMDFFYDKHDKEYQEYKIKELEIRNNLKLGVPSLNEFHIEKEVSIFFKNQKNISTNNKKISF